MRDAKLYRDTVKYFESVDNELVDHQTTGGECKEHGPCPLSKIILERYNFARLAVRMYEVDNGEKETALPGL